jgi:hypothetical protein
VIISLNSVNHSIFVMVNCGVLFEVQTKYLNTIQTSFDFKGLMQICVAVFHSNHAGRETGTASPMRSVCTLRAVITRRSHGYKTVRGNGRAPYHIYKIAL